MSEVDALLDDDRFLILDRGTADRLDALRGPRRRDPRRANQYGGKGIIKFAASPDDVNAGIRSEATLVDWGSRDGQTHPVTVEIGRIANGGGGSFPLGTSGGSSLSYRVQASIIIGTPGAMSDPFFVDIGRGQRFTAAASYVAVTALMLAPPAGYASGSLAVVGALGLGAAFRQADPLYSTQYADAIAIGGAQNIAIPPRAITLEDFVASAPSSFTATILDASGRVLRAINTSTIGTRANAVPLSADASQIQITNNTGAAASVELLFGISV